jgi:hypothetical protein
VYKYHIFLIHSSVVGHLGCFHNLAIMNSTVINMGVRVPLSSLCCIPLGISPGVVLMDHKADLCLDF